MRANALRGDDTAGPPRKPDTARPVLDCAHLAWGDPLAAGTVFRTPEQVHAIGPALGIGMGMLGGCMWPHSVPHAWAVDAWTTLLSRNGDLSAIMRDPVVLAGCAVVLLTCASLAPRHHRLTAGAGV